ncbi:MAG: branched-chain amino acid ABC transporter substrate-binding protein [Acidobacteriota bacterium]
MFQGTGNHVDISRWRTYISNRGEKMKAEWFRSVVTFVAALSLGILLGCGGGRDVKIAVAGPLTGPEAPQGKAVLNGVTLSVAHWNKAGGILGKKIVLIQKNDEDDPAKAAAVAKELVKARPLVVVGHVDSGCSLRAAPIYQRNKIVMISPTSTSPKLTESGWNHVFRVCGRDDLQGRAAAVWIVKHGQGNRVAVVHDGSEYAKGLSDEFKSNYEFLSSNKVVADVAVQRGDLNMDPVALQLKAANPDLVYFGGLADQGGALLKAMRKESMSATFMAGDGCFEPEFLEAAGPGPANGAMVTFMPDFSSLPGTGIRAFMNEYREKFGKTPGPTAIYGYEAANIALAAASKAPTPLNDRTLMDTLHQLTFKTGFGLIRFDDRGDPTEIPYVVWRVMDGRFEEIGN